MPRVGELLGVLFYIYADDHSPPHVHAIYGDRAMQIVIATGEVLEGSLPGSKERVALGWVDANRAAVAAAWNRLNPTNPLVL